MTFIWPKLLGLLVVVPVLVYGYVRIHRQRVTRVAQLAAQGLVSMNPLGRKRHVPIVLFLAGITVLAVAAARPQMNVSIPRREGTVMLVFDTSNSMMADDLKPSRMEAAKEAARGFVAKQPPAINIGVVAFGEGGFVTQVPTDNRADVLAAINLLKPAGATSLGKGIFTALGAIAGKPIVLPVDPAGESAADIGDVDVESIDIGYFGSGVIVLLSDGENNTTPDPVKVAELAGVAGVRIYPIGVGSPEGTVLTIDGFSSATTLDTEQLTAIAEASDGTFFSAADEEALADIYDNIDLQFVSKAEQNEVTGLFAGAGTLLFFVGSLLSLLWFGRVV